jgi:hypothetical protein
MTDLVERVIQVWNTHKASRTDAHIARATIRVVLEEAASYIDGKGGEVIPGASVFASLVSRNNMPCMSGDPRDRLNRLDRRAFDERMTSLADAVRNLLPKEEER